jgi:hypothetical protein
MEIYKKNRMNICPVFFMHYGFNQLSISLVQAIEAMVPSPTAVVI